MHIEVAEVLFTLGACTGVLAYGPAQDAVDTINVSTSGNDGCLIHGDVVKANGTCGVEWSAPRPVSLTWQDGVWG